MAHVTLLNILNVVTALTAVIYSLSIETCQKPLFGDSFEHETPSNWVKISSFQWQPLTCTMKHFAQQDVEMCGTSLDGLHISFVGDSTIREVYHSFVSLFGVSSPILDLKHKDQTFHSSNVDFDFLWNPFLNRSLSIKRKAKRHFVVATSNHWWIRHYPDNIAIVGRNDALSQFMKDHSHARVILRPAPPVIDDLLSPRRKNMTLDRVDILNQQLEIYSNPDVPLLYNSFNLYATRPDKEHLTSDGVHFDSSVVSVEADLLLNYICNPFLSYKPSQLPSTCCVTWKRPSVLTTMFFIAMIATALHSPNSGTLVLIPIMLYCYIADRTPLIPKQAKLVSPLLFFILSLLTLIPGHTVAKISDPVTPGFLARYQTEEWRGWMQLIILIYHYTGTSKVSYIYNVIRVMVGSYLFMTGFGHFSYYYKSKKFELKRILSVLFRLNVLPFLLSSFLDAPYMQYYFSPLVSFWFIVISLTMWIGHGRNENSVFLWGKFGLVWGSILLSLHFKLWDAPFSKLGWDGREWMFRMGLDFLAPLAGCVFGHYCLHHDLTSFSISRVQANIAIFLGVGYFSISSLLDKLVYNKFHPYISMIPISLFVLTRNATPNLRALYSPFYREAGLISLDLFILQFHIWLGQDTRSVLTLFPARWGLHSLFENVFATLSFSSLTFLLWQCSVYSGNATDVLVKKFESLWQK
jgi:hypothetical protein